METDLKSLIILEETGTIERKQQIMEVVNPQLFYKLLLKYDGIAVHLKGNKYNVIPIEHLFVPMYYH